MAHGEYGGSSGLRENTSRGTHGVVAELLFADSGRLQRVLDLPAGEGAFTRRLLDRGLDVISGDIEPIHKVPEAKFALCDMNQRLPFHDGSFDAVVCIDGIEHIERPFDFVAECRRILRPGGAILLSTPNITALRSRWRWLLTGFHNKGKVPLNEANPNPLHHIGLLSFPELRYMLHRSGFQITAIRTNRVKAISWIYAPLVPFAYLLTARVFGKEEKDPGQRLRNREILRQMFSRDLLFGETMIVKAVKSESPA